ncbi:MAG TPA: pentapeptide repeat-containing protein [Pyrinomonadaceae bacterium]|nr:pentapeptide repeat-containing protein [Pyrinomonadaceae bacterium]
MPSQALLPSRRFVLHLRAAFLILVGCFLFAACAPAQTPAPTPPPDATPHASREDQQLSEARRQNEEALAEYYRTLTKKVTEQTTRTLWRTLLDNAALLGALTAALVALSTLLVNQRTALRARKDTEFYEALKRFGDKDSPTVRASAAAMLAQIGDTWFYTFPRRRPDKRWNVLKGKPWSKAKEWLKKRVRTYPYFNTALDQLVTGLLIEEHTVVNHAIVTALKSIWPKSIKRAAERLYDSNLRLTADLKTLLTEYFAAKGSTKPDQVGEEAWKEATNLTRCSLEGLKALVTQYSSWEESERITSAAEKRLRMKTIKSGLKDLGRRLNQNIRMFEMVFRERPDTANDSLNFFSAYLANASLSGANLRNINFARAVMPGVFLMGASLGGAKLEDTNLEGSHCHSVDFTDAKLYGVRVNRENLPFEYTNWWQANYEAGWWKETPAVIDEDLITKLIEQFGELSPDKLKAAHRSVKAYVEKRNRLKDDEVANQNT